MYMYIQFTKFTCFCVKTYASSCAGHQLYERGVDLEVEGVRYIEMHRGPAAYVLGPPSLLQGAETRTRRRSQCMPHRVDYVYESRECHVEVPSNGFVEISLLPVCTVETSI